MAKTKERTPADISPVRQRGEMTLIEHLEELRGRLIKIGIAYLVASTAAWFFYDRILSVLVAPLKQLPESDLLFTDGKLVFVAPQEPFFVRLKVTAFVGLVLCVPVILWQLWRFVTPGLYANEKKFALPFVLVASLLFVGGGAFAFTLLPQALRILLGFAGVETVILPRAQEYLSFVLILVLAFGITFEIPLVLLSLTIAGVISSSTLKRWRRYAWLVMFFIAAIVTPTGDPYTMMIMGLPLVVLYEVTILISRLMKR